jgi:two-component system, chemotaxis family, chemotaxis protein CheY
VSKILIADDASFMRLLIREILSSRRYTDIFEAENGEVAFEMFQTYRPDLTLLDITMPVRDGISTLSDILAIDPKAKVIICSAVAQEKVIQDALNSGAIDFIIKPFRRQQFLDIVEKYLPKSI